MATRTRKTTRTRKPARKASTSPNTRLSPDAEHRPAQLGATVIVGGEKTKRNVFAIWTNPRRKGELVGKSMIGGKHQIVRGRTGSRAWKHS